MLDLLIFMRRSQTAALTSTANIIGISPSVKPGRRRRDKHAFIETSRAFNVKSLRSQNVRNVFDENKLEFVVYVIMN